MIQKKQKTTVSLFIVFILMAAFQAQCKKSPTSPDVEEYTKPVIWMDTFELSFSAKEKGDNPSSQSISVRNTGQKTLDYTISDDAEWLSIEPGQGSSSGEEVTHTVSVNKSGMSAKGEEYKAIITISSEAAYNSPQEIKVGLEIVEKMPPKIMVSPQRLSFSAQEGKSSISSKSINIKNAGEGTLDYSISRDSSWLSVAPYKGRSQGESKTHTVSIDTKGLKSGTHTSKLIVKDPAASNSPKEVEISVNISEEKPPQIWVSSQTISFNTQEGASSPASKNIFIKNTGEGTLDYSITCNPSWVAVSPQSGRSNGGKITHTVSLDTRGMSSGSYKGKIVVRDSSAANNPQEIMVYLEIAEQQPPQIWVSPQSLAFNSAAGGSNPSSKTMYIKNAGGGTLSYQVSPDSSWLSVSPNSGSSNGGKKGHTVSVNIQGLNAGSYSGSLSIVDSSATNSPAAVNVALEISSSASDNTISLSCDPASGGTNTIVEIPISIYGNSNEINDFGLDLTFDSNMFAYQSVAKGNLTSDWSYIDGNEVSSGVLRVGGFAGTAMISKGSKGIIAVVKLKVISTASSDSQSKLSIQSYIDDIAGMSPEPASASFTYKK
jgi:hypothetical protein